MLNMAKLTKKTFCIMQNVDKNLVYSYRTNDTFWAILHDSQIV